MPRLYLPDAAPGRHVLDGERAHYLARVLRVPVGAAVAVFDGRGHEWAATVVSLARTATALEIGAPRAPLAEPSVRLTLACGVLTGADDMGHVIRDATAMGVAAIAPFISDHVSVSEKREWGAARERWTRVAVAAATQSGRAVVPIIEQVARLDDILAADEKECLVVAVEPAAVGVMSLALPASRPTRATLFSGPEGGWSPRELDRFSALGASGLTCGPRRLTAVLAPTVALATLWTSWNWE